MEFLEFKSITAVTPSIKSFASMNDDHPLVTTDPLLTKLNVENFAHVTFEVDSAASHNIISKTNFDKIQKQLKIRGKRAKRLENTIKIRLADGKLSSQNCHVVQLMLSTNLNKNAKLSPYTFIVVKGPNNLIGRHTLARLWLEEFDKFKSVATSNYKLALPKNADKCDVQIVNKAQINNVSVKN